MRDLRWMAVVVLLCSAALPVIGQIGGMYDITDIKARSSSPKMKTGGHHVATGTRNSRIWQAAYLQKKQQHDQLVRAKFASEAPRPNLVGSLVLALTSAAGRPVSGLTLQATITDKTPRVTTRTLVTNSAGRVRIQGISPLPARVDLALAPDHKLADGTPEWVPERPTDASLFIGPSAKKTAELNLPTHMHSSTWSLELTSYSRRGKAARPSGTVRASSVKTAIYQDERSIPVKRNVVDFELIAPVGAYVYRA